jgi:hypothetical protein
MLCRLFLWWRYECQRRWDMNLTSGLARVEFVSAVCMPFGLYRDSIQNNVNITINRSPIQQVQYTKYLGIQIDCYVRWTSMCNT